MRYAVSMLTYQNGTSEVHACVVSADDRRGALQKAMKQCGVDAIHLGRRVIIPIEDQCEGDVFLSEALRVALNREAAMRDTLDSARKKANEEVERRRYVERKLDEFKYAVECAMEGLAYTDSEAGWTMLSDERYVELLMKIEDLESKLQGNEKFIAEMS